MNNAQEIRWKQRFKAFEKAFDLLDKYVHKDKLTELERAGLIQFYEITFELSWKVMKDYLWELGYDTKSPRETIKTAYQAGIVEDGYLWIDALQDRNLTTHIYDEQVIDDITQKIINAYYPMIKKLYEFFRTKYNS